MACPENNKKNRRELAEKIVSLYDVDDLREYVINVFTEDYSHDDDDFRYAWQDFKDSFEWSKELCESMKKDCPNPGCHCGRCEKKDNNIEDWQIEEALNGRR